MTYKPFKRFSLDPNNEREVLELAVTRAFQSSGGELNAFNAGSPLITILESLTSSHMEFLFWLNSLPEAMVLTFLAECLGANRNYGSKCQAVLEVTLTEPRSVSTILRSGTKVFNNKNSEIFYEFEEDLTISAGSSIGYVNVTAAEVGPEYVIEANTLTVLNENFSYISAVNNPAPSTIGLALETLEQVKSRVQTLMTQVTPVSIQDWYNILEIYFPNKATKVLVKDGVLYIYVQDYTFNSSFETYANEHVTALQKVLIAPLEKALLQITIESTLNFNNEECLNIATSISKNLLTFINKALQPIDIYNNFANEILNARDISNFDVLYYYEGLSPDYQGIVLQAFDFVNGQILKNFNNELSLVTTNFNIVSSALHEAALGYLRYHPVYTTLGPGFYSAQDVVLVNSQYYLITSTGAFDVANSTNWVLLPTPISWANNVSVSTTDFILEPSLVAGLSHGFVPLFNYTTTEDLSNNWVSIVPVIVQPGNSIAPGQYWSYFGLEEVLFLNSGIANFIAPAIRPIENLLIFQQPDPFYNELTRKSKYSIGQITTDNNRIFVTSSGATANIPTGLILPPNTTSQDNFGTFITEDGVIYEVLESFVPTNADTIQTLLAGNFIKKAYKIYDEFEYLIVNTEVPYFFDIELIYFKQANEKVVTKSLNNYTVTEL